MGWIILTVLASIVFWAALGTAVYLNKKRAAYEAAGRDPYDMIAPVYFTGAAIVTIVVWLLITLGLMLHTVGQREVAIVYNFSGTIAGKKDPGIVMTAPWQHVRKENVGIQHDEWAFGPDNSAVSQDQQQVFATLAVNYQIDSENVVDLYQRVGQAWKTIIIDARVPQVFKETTASYPTQRITEEREKLRSDVRTRLTEELKPYDIRVVDVFITNLGFSETYRQAIEAKQKQVQEALQAQAKVKQVEAEARQKVAEAEGEAKSNVARARGEATANRLRSRSLTPAILRLRAIETLNDNVQIIVCPPKSVCIPNSTVVPEP